ncbi:RNA cytosine-C(5)-methyltransferase NSUN2-like [Babylonia areolata]|uniref:RNA cytosine-C(5)-methyltransferase NSUN2-like n=1 Tax=Babylonia areolata TaxID=304850 RepID=UPI003FD614A5
MRLSFLFLIPERNRHFITFVKMGRRKRQNKRNFNKNPEQYKNERNYKQTPKENELFKKYYAGLGLMPAEEVELFYNQMKEPLPVTFRITGYKSQAKELLKIIRTNFLDNLIGKATSSATSATTNTLESSGSNTNGAAVGTGGDSSASDAAALVAGATESAREGDGGEATPTVTDGGGDCEGVAKGLTMEAIKPPKCLSWYPDELAWQIDLSRKAVRSQEFLNKLHLFLVSETETGNISRQEAVSMIPPLVLNVQSNSKVLDMCAAPGSKTAQLIEYLHKDENQVPEGFVVANDKENKRCYLMVHQVKRLASPCCMIVNHDASIFPKLRCSPDEDKQEHMLFDRVLADVPCSGDGTMRKNIDIWKKWHPAMGNSLHGLQLKILKRGVELLEVGGRLVYSTCSMQPVEDEAVIAEMLRKCEGTMKLVDISSYLPGFKTVPGLSQWKLMNKLGQWVPDFESVPERFKQQYNKSMFPPTPEEAKRFNLHLCHRILPHHQDTGGFFVAALEKVDHLPWSREARLEREKASKAGTTPAQTASSLSAQPQPAAPPSPPAESAPEEGSGSSSVTMAVSSSSAQNSGDGGGGAAECGNSRKRKAESEEGPQPKKRDLKGYKEDPFLFLEPDDPVYPAIRDFYGLAEGFPIDQLLYRSEKGPKRALYFVNKAIRQIVTCNEGRVRFINMGVKFVTRSPSPLVTDCDFRITQECLGSLRDMFTKRVVPVTRGDAVTIFREENPFLNKMHEDTQKALGDICPGSVVFLYRPTESEPEPACEIAFCGWRGKMSVRCFVPRFERAHALRLFGQDLEQIRAEVSKMKAERKEKLAAEAAAASASAPDGDNNDDNVPTQDADEEKSLTLVKEELEEEEEAEIKTEEALLKETEGMEEGEEEEAKEAVE